jgi:hypothetical protein
MLPKLKIQGKRLFSHKFLWTYIMLVTVHKQLVNIGKITNDENYSFGFYSEY